MNQRDKTKHKSLRVVFFGRKHVFQLMQTELGFVKSDVFNISWIVVEHSEDTSPPFHSINALENGTYVISPSVYNIQGVSDLWKEKLSRSQPADQLEQLIKCSGQSQITDFTNKNIVPTIDAVFVIAAALQRQIRWYNCGGTLCAALRENFEFKLDEVQRFPVSYRDTDENVTVAEFSDANRRPSFERNGEFLPDVTMILYDVIYITNRDNFTKVNLLLIYMYYTLAQQSST